MNEEQEKNLVESVQTLTELVEELRKQNYLDILEDKKKFLWYNFLTGAAKGLGFVIGSTLLLALFLWIASQLLTVPVIGEWMADLINYVREAQLR